MNRIIDAGYPYELAGLAFYVLFLFMVRKPNGTRYTLRTRVLTLLTAIALVGVVPFHYGANTPAVVLIMVFAGSALVSAFVDARASG